MPQEKRLSEAPQPKKRGLYTCSGARKPPEMKYDAHTATWVILGLWREDWHLAKRRNWQRSNNGFWWTRDTSAAVFFRRYADDNGLERLGYYRNPTGHICKHADKPRPSTAPPLETSK